MENLAIAAKDALQEDIVSKIFHKQFNSDMEIIEMSKKGVTKATLIAFMHYLNFSPDQFAALLPITLRTIQRYSNEKVFTPNISEHIILLVLLVKQGIAVFGSLKSFVSWFNASSQALGGRRPCDLVCFKVGTQMVKDELGRIEYGVYA